MFRVTTRADWDGLVCAALLSVVEDVDRYRFIEPGPFQSGEGEVTPEDIIANLPYRPRCALWFDHHISNKLTSQEFRGSWWVAPSAARVIYEYYGQEGLLDEFEELVSITDRIDSAHLFPPEVLNPEGFILLSMTVDGKKPEDEPYWRLIISLLVSNDYSRLFSHPQIASRCGEFLQTQAHLTELLQRTARVVGGVLLTDWRGQDYPILMNRFLPFALFPEVHTWVKVADYPQDPSRVHISVSLSIFNPSSSLNVGTLMVKFGGGGHRGAGTCRPEKGRAEKVIKEILDSCTEVSPLSV